MKKESITEACARIRKEAEIIAENSGRQWMNKIIDMETNTIDVDHTEVNESEESHEVRKLLYNPLTKSKK